MSLSVFVLRAESSGVCGLRQARNKRATFSRMKLKTSYPDYRQLPITTSASPQPPIPFIHAPIMGGLTYGTYGAGTALTVIGLCMFGNHKS